MNYSVPASADHDVGAHPGMDAALIVMHAGLFHVRRRDAAGQDEVRRPELQAFGCRHRVSGQVVENGHDAAAEVVDFRERVRFATNVPRLHRLSLTEPNDARSEQPSASLATS